MSAIVNNAFSLLEVDEIPSPINTPVSSPKVSSSAFTKVQVKKSWAEMMDDEEDFDDLDFPSLSLTGQIKTSTITNIINEKKEQETKKIENEKIEKAVKQEAIDDHKKHSKLAKMKQCVIKRVAPTFNKAKNVLEYVEKTRVLNVVSEEHFKRTCDLINRLKTHNKNGTDVKEQIDKIRISNSLLEWCYKPKDKTYFVFCCARLHLKDGKNLVVEHVDPKTRFFFDLEEFVYSPPESN